jgi:hypothetical protein
MNKSKFHWRQKLAARIISAVWLIFDPLSIDTPFTPSPCPSYCHCSRVIAVATIAVSKRVTIALVATSATPFRRATHDVKVCPWLNEIMIPITVISMYHCNCVLRSQVIAFDVTNVIAECDCELRRGVFAAVFPKAIHHGEYSCHCQHNFLLVVALTITHLIIE